MKLKLATLGATLMAIIWFTDTCPGQSNLPPVITMQPSNQVYAGNNPVTFSVGTTGAGPLTYQWVFNGNYLPNNLITTVAGTNAAEFSGDGGPAARAGLNRPSGVTLDEDGNLFIADTFNERIRRVDTNGVITTVAGNGLATFNGVVTVATNSALNAPSGVALDADDNLFIADTYNERIRVDTYDMLITVAGNGNEGYSGDGAAAYNAELNRPYGVAVDADGNIYIADTENSRIRKVDVYDNITTVAGTGTNGYSGDGGAATNAKLWWPFGVTVDASGNLFIADTDNNRIRKVDTNGIITTVAGSAEQIYSGDGGPATNAALSRPEGVALDASGDLFIADTSNNRIRKVGANGIITSLAGNGGPGGFSGDGVVATNSSLDNPSGVAVDASGNVYIADAFNNRVRKVTPQGPALILANPGQTNAGNYQVIVSNPFGSVTSSVAVLAIVSPPVITNQPQSQFVWSGSNGVFSVGVSGTGPLAYQWQFDGTNLPLGIISTVAGRGISGSSGDTGPATNADLESPVAVAVDGGGNRFIADEGAGRIRKVDLNGIITAVAGRGGFGFSGDGGPATNASLGNPAGVAVDASGNLFITDTYNFRIRKVNTSGIITTVAGNGSSIYSGDGGAATNAGLPYPTNAVVDALGNLFVTSGPRIREVYTNGTITTVAGNGASGFSGDGGAATNASLSWPSGEALDASGNLFIADRSNNRIRMVNTNGIISTVAGNGTNGYSGDGGAATNAALNNPTGVAVDACENLFIADNSNQRIRRVDTGGIITTVAGKGTAGYGGDGGPAISALLSSPTGVAVDASGNLLIADTINHRVRAVNLPGPMLFVNNVTAGNAGDYQVIVTNAYGSVTSSVALLVLPPVITPSSVLTTNGGLAAFNVALPGTTPFSFQWQLDGTNLTDGGAIAGSGTTNLILTPVTTNNAGLYTVVTTSPWGSVTSSAAPLGIAYPPAITRQPADQNIIAGQNGTLSVGFSGTWPVTFQWMLNGTNLPNNVISTVAGNGIPEYAGNAVPATNASLDQPYGVTMDASGNLYIGDTYNQRIRIVNANGIITTFAGNGVNTYTGDGGLAIHASLNYPEGSAVDGQGNLYIADTLNQRVRKIGANGLITTVAGNGTAGFSGDGGVATNASLNTPCGVALDAYGNLYIDDKYNGRVREVNANGLITTVAGINTTNYSGDGGAATNAGLSYPTGVAFDALDNLFIADAANGRVRKVDSHGIITTVAGLGTNAFSGDGGPATAARLNNPYAVAVDAYGNLFIADSQNERIRRVDTNGIITTVAGDGTNTYSGDGGVATNAGLNLPHGVALDAYGDLLIADTANARVRQVTIQGPVLPVANVNPANAGNYQVIIASAWGSVTSSVATLTVTPPQISVASVTNGSVTLDLLTAPNVSSELWTATNLVPPVFWQSVCTNLNGTNALWQFTDTNTGQSPVRFYRTSTP